MSIGHWVLRKVDAAMDELRAEVAAAEACAMRREPDASYSREAVKRTFESIREELDTAYAVDGPDGVLAVLRRLELLQ